MPPLRAWFSLYLEIPTQATDAWVGHTRPDVLDLLTNTFPGTQFAAHIILRPQVVII